MIVHRCSRIFASLFRLINDLLKIFPFAIPEQNSEFASAPAFNAVIFSRNLFKLIKEFLYFFRFHIASVVMVAFAAGCFLEAFFKTELWPI